MNRSINLLGSFAVAVVWSTGYVFAEQKMAPPSRGAGPNPPIRTLAPPCDREGESPIEPRTKRSYAYGFFGATGGATLTKHTRWHHQTRTWTYR